MNTQSGINLTSFWEKRPSQSGGYDWRCSICALLDVHFWSSWCPVLFGEILLSMFTSEVSIASLTWPCSVSWNISAESNCWSRWPGDNHSRFLLLTCSCQSRHLWTTQPSSWERLSQTVLVRARHKKALFSFVVFSVPKPFLILPALADSPVFLTSKPDLPFNWQPMT